MFQKATLILAVICGLGLAAVACQDSLDHQLTAQFKDRLLALRHPFMASSQEYEAEGKCTTTSDEGPWTMYGRIMVTKVRIDHDKLRLEGKRVFYLFDEHKKRFLPFRDSEHVTISIRLRGPLTSADQAVAVLNPVFALGNDDSIGAVPPYWRTYLSTKDPGTSTGPAGPRQSQGNDDWITPEPEGSKVFHIGTGVGAPKAVYSPEPEFTSAARKRKFQGVVGLNVVINKEGAIGQVSIIKPAGLGLDENAVKTIKTWRFDPAMKDGQPVAVSVYIEVDFRLYARR